MTRLVVLLGASNLSFGLRPLLGRIACAGAPATEILLARGPGRSYVLPTGNPLWQYPPLSGCDLWPELERRLAATPDARVYALITDVGNDLVYTRGHDLPARALTRIAARLAGYGARVVVTGLPLASIADLSEWQFHMIRRFFFPGTPVTRDATLTAAMRLQAHLQALCAQHGFAMHTAAPDCYGLDRFHLKRRRRAAVFDTWINLLLGPPEGPAQHLPVWRPLPPARRDVFLGRARTHEGAPVALSPEVSLAAF